MNLIAAADENWGIGKNGGLLAHISGDMKYFRETTKGKIVVMGRKTLEGLPGGQPLGNRVNVVLSENPDYKIKGAVVCHNIDEALKYLKQFSSEDIYVIGGESIFRQFLPYCNTVYLTHIDYEYDADVKFPVNLWKSQEWEMVEEGEEQTYFSLCYTPEIFVRKQV